MQRNLKSEIAVAGVAIVLVLFVFAMATFLSSTTSDLPTITPTEAVVASNLGEDETPKPTATPRSIATIEPLTPTVLSRATIEITNTTLTPSYTPTNDNTLTPTITPSPTQRATLAITLSAVATITARATETATLTATITPSPTLRAPSATLRPRSTLTVPTATSMPTLTVAPSHTPTKQTTVPVPTLLASATPSVVSRTLQPSASEASLTPTRCALPSGWTRYTVQSGNTLFAIALAVNSTVESLRVANCLADADTIQVGQVLFVPRLPTRPVSTASASQSDFTRLSVIGCISSEATITYPSRGEKVTSPFNVIGSAVVAPFWYYKLEVRAEGSQVYNFYGDSQIPVENGVLGQINPALFGKGIFWVRLSVVDSAGVIQPHAVCEIPLLFE